jgi:hypothetical protein
MSKACGKAISDLTLSFQDWVFSAFCKATPVRLALLLRQLYASAISKGYVDASNIKESNESGYSAIGETRDCSCSEEISCGELA